MSKRSPWSSRSRSRSKTLASRTLTFREPVARRVRLHPRERLRRDVHREHLVRHRRGVEREAAVVGEGVEHASAGVAAGRRGGSRAGRGRGRSSGPSRGRPESGRRPPPPRPAPGTSPKRSPTRCSSPSSWRTFGSFLSRTPSGGDEVHERAHDLVLAPLGAPARASGPPGSRRSGRPRARAGRRPRRGPGGRRGARRHRLAPVEGPPQAVAQERRPRAPRPARSCAGGSRSATSRRRSPSGSPRGPGPAPPRPA